MKGRPEEFNHMFGLGGNDKMTGSPGSDLIRGNEGNDLIEWRRWTT